MPPIRILIVDDSAVIRKVLSDGLASDLGHRSRRNGGQRANRAQQNCPSQSGSRDLGHRNAGHEWPRDLGRDPQIYPKLPVIMFSTLTERGAATTLDALALGASDYVTKPSNTGSLELTLAQIREQLIPKVKALCPSRLQTQVAPISQVLRPRPALPQVRRESASVEVLAIGTSTGGPNALAELIPAIPADFPVPVVIVQHMPPVFTRLLAARLNEKSALTVQEGKAGATLKAGEAWIAPGDYHMTVERRGISVRIGDESGSSGKFLPSRRRSIVSLGCKGVWAQCSVRCFDWHGFRRRHRCATYSGKGRASIRAG